MKINDKLLYSVLAIVVGLNTSVFADCKMENGAYVVGLSSEAGKRISLRIDNPANAQSEDLCTNFHAEHNIASGIRIPVKPIKLDGSAIEQQYKDLVAGIKKRVSAKIKKGKTYTPLKLKVIERADFSKPGPMGEFRTILQAQTPNAKISVTIDLERVQSKDGKILVGEQVPELSVEYAVEFK